MHEAAPKTDQKMLLGGAGGSPFMAVQIIVNRALSGQKKVSTHRRYMRRGRVYLQRFMNSLKARFVGTYSGAGTLEGGTSGEAIRLKKK